MLLLFLLAPAGLSGQFAVYPVLVDLDATARVGTETVTVQNQGTETLEVRVYLSDYDRLPGGDHTYVSFGEHPSTCSDRLEAFPDQLSLEPGEQGEIRLRMQPDSTTCWSMVFVERRVVGASGITTAQRIGVKVLAEGTDRSREGRVVSVAADTAAGPAALVGFESQGTAALEVTGEIEIRDLSGEVVGVVQIDPFRVLPGRERRVRVELDGAGLEAGRYLMVAILDFDGDYLAGGQAMLEIEP